MNINVSIKTDLNRIIDVNKGMSVRTVKDISIKIFKIANINMIADIGETLIMILHMNTNITSKRLWM